MAEHIMRKKIWSNFILVAMISVCIGAVASPDANTDAVGDGQTRNSPSLSASAGDMARSLLLASTLPDSSGGESGAQTIAHSPPSKSITERALEDAAQSAGEVASELEMPFFSFGGRASSE
jgi:hypothetical protein